VVLAQRINEDVLRSFSRFERGCLLFAGRAVSTA